MPYELPEMKKIILLLLLAFGWTDAGLAQGLGTGTYAFAPLENLGFDQINLGNLNTRFTIPIVSRTGRGIPFQYSINYEGLVWQPVNGTWVSDAGWGFHGQLNDGVEGYLTFGSTTHTWLCQDGTTVYGTSTHNYAYHDPFGSVHSLNWGTVPCPNDTTAFDGSSKDGSGYTYDGQFLHDRNGRILSVPENTTIGVGGLTDSNGNYISDNGSGSFTDTLGAAALNISGAGVYGQPKTFTYPVARQSNSNITTATATISYTHYYITTNFGCSGIGEVGQNGDFSADLPDTIQLASGDTYHFGYELTPGFSGRITGRLAQITLPTGGHINYIYKYGCGQGINSDGTPGSLVRTLDDGTHRTYSRASLSAGTATTMTDEEGNDTYYTFAVDTASGYFFNKNKNVYQGAASGNGDLYDQYTCYNGAPFPCDSAVPTLPITAVSVLSSPHGATQALTVAHYATNGLMTDTTDGLGRKTTLTYNDYGGLTSSITTDSASNTVASASYGYDETTPTATSNIPQHTASGGAHGNQTSSHISLITSPGTIDTTTAYYDTGVPVSTTTSSGTTTFGYDSTQGFVTSTTLPTPSSGVSLSTGAAYDVNSGAQLSTTGLNGEQTSVTTYDPLMRPTVVTPPSGAGVVTTTYNDPNHVSVSQQMNAAGQSTDQETYYDPYGRVIRVSTQTDSNQWYVTDTCYDTLGRVQYRSLPYASTSQNPGGNNCGAGTATMYSYDALGRTLSVGTPAGDHKSMTYTGHAVQTVADTTKIVQHDALGRISAICEVSSTIYGGQSPQACNNLDISGTGYLTTYAYNDANHTTTITQGTQTRTFTTDALGRTTDLVEPESGETTYSYAYNGTGLLVTRTRGAANSTSAGATTTTSTQYDSLGRVLTVSYSDGTPYKYFEYDQADAGEGFPATNMKGRMTHAATSGTGAWTWFTYDPVGNVTFTLQCFPGHCGQPGFDVVRYYQYDLAGNRTKESYLQNGCCGTQTDINTTYNIAGQTTGMNDTLTGTNNANGALVGNVTTGPSGVLVGDIQNGPFGPTAYKYGDTNWGARVYDSNGRNWGKYLCSLAAAFQCGGAGNSQLYGTQYGYSGSRVTRIDDTALQVFSDGSGDLTYDDLNRLASFPGFTYSYDRWGNRTNQNVTSGTGPQPSFSFTSKNQIVGYTYDLAGNLTNDGMHTYTYDAEGNLTQVDGGVTATYYYDALNRRVREDSNNGQAITDYEFNIDGKRASTWDGYAAPLTLPIKENLYWNGEPVAYWIAGTNQSVPTLHTRALRDQSTPASACGSAWDVYTSELSSVVGYQIQHGDILEFDHMANVAQGGFRLNFGGSLGSGVYSGDDTDYNPDGDWHHTSFPLETWVGSTVQGAVMATQQTTPLSGWWDLYIANALIRSADGTTHLIYTSGGDSASATLWNPCGGNDFSFDTETLTEPNGTIHFQHQDLLGTERMRTAQNGSVEGTYTSLPFGERLTFTGTDDDADHFANLDHDTSSDTHHAQFRQYSSTQGRWMSPDPYLGSYDYTNPQSMNRYAYTLNNPLFAKDPTGLFQGCDRVNQVVQSIVGWEPDEGDGYGGTIATPIYGFNVISTVVCLGTPASAPLMNQPKKAPSKGMPKTPSQCAGEALKNNAVALSLDVAGVGAGFLPGGDLVVAGAQATISVASGINGAVQYNGTANSAAGSVLGVLGLPATFTSYAAKAIGVGGKALPGVGAVVSGLGALSDAYGTYMDYQSCMAGHS